MNDRLALEQLASSIKQIHAQVTALVDDEQYDEEIMYALENVQDALDLCEQYFEEVL